MNTADLFLWILDNLNYWVVALFMAIESSFIPFPSEVVVPPAAWKAMDPSSGMSFILVIVFATIGADLGALINYYLAKWVGRPIIYRFADSRIGHMCLIDRQKVEVAEEYFRKHGAASTILEDWCQPFASSSVFLQDWLECTWASSCSTPLSVQVYGTLFWQPSDGVSTNTPIIRQPMTFINKLYNIATRLVMSS